MFEEKRSRKGEFTLDDFRKQLSQMAKLGPMKKIMGMIPGMGAMKKMIGDTDIDYEMKRLFGIINSMTADERRNPNKVIDQSRRRRIAIGAGVKPADVGNLVKQFHGMVEIMKSMAGTSMRDPMLDFGSRWRH